MKIKVIPFFYFLFFWVGFCDSDLCLDYDPINNFCNVCKYDKYLVINGINYTQLENFDPNACVNKTNMEVTKDIFVDSAFECNPSCDGNFTNPFSQLMMAFLYIQNNLSSYSEINVMVYLLKGANYFSIYYDYYEEIYLFRRMNLNITISPLFCKEKNIAGCFENEFEKTQILLKNPNLIFFCANSLTLKNIILNGIDTNLFYNLNSTLREETKNQQICTEQDLESLSEDEIKYFCFLSNQKINEKVSEYGLFNIEYIIDCIDCQTPSLSFLSCEFIYFNVLSMKNNINIVSSLIHIIFGTPSFISVSQTIFLKSFFVNGIISFNYNSDPYYKYLSDITKEKLFELINFKTITIEISIDKSMISSYNFYSISLVESTSVSLFNLNNTFNKMHFNSHLSDLNLEIYDTTIENAVDNIYLEQFSFIMINGFGSKSIFKIENNTIQRNKNHFFLQLLCFFSLSLIKNSKFLNNINEGISISSYSELIYQDNLISNLTFENSASFFYFSDAKISIENCLFLNVSAAEISHLISIQTKLKLSVYDLFIDALYFLNASYDSLIIKNSSMVGFTLISLLQTDTTVSKIHIKNCSFLNFAMDSLQNFILSSVEYEIVATQVKFEGICGKNLFNLPYSRNKIFIDLLLTNSNVSLFSGRVVGSYHDELIYFINMTLNNIFIDNSMQIIQIYCDFLTIAADLVIENAQMRSIYFLEYNFAVLFFIRNCMFILIKNVNMENIYNSGGFYIMGYGTELNSLLNLSSLALQNDFNDFFYITDISFIYLEKSIFICNRPELCSYCSNYAISSFSYPNGYLVISECFMKNLKNLFKGGALSLKYQNARRILITNCIFENNGAENSDISDIGITFLENDSEEMDINKENFSEMFKNFNLFCLDLENQLYQAEMEECMNFSTNLILKIGTYDFFNVSLWNSLLNSYGIQFSSFLNSNSLSINIYQDTALLLKDVIFSQNINTTKIYQSPLIIITPKSSIFAYNTSISNYVSYSDGGFAYFFSSTIGFFYNCTAMNITSLGNGAFIYIKGGLLTLIDFYSIHLLASNGALVYSDESTVNFSSVIILNSSAELMGGGVFLTFSSFYSSNSSFISLKSIYQGAAIYANRPNSLIFYKSNFSNCETQKNGLIFISGLQNIWIKFINILCEMNKAEGGSCIFLREGNIEIEDSNFENNYGDNYLIYMSSAFAETSVSIQNTLFWNNNLEKIIFCQRCYLEIENLKVLQNTSRNSFLDLKFCEITINNALFMYEMGKNIEFQDSIYLYNFFDTTATIYNSSFYMHSNLQIGCIFSEKTELKINSNVFQQCGKSLNGGALQIIDLSILTIENSNFSSNLADLGGAIYIQNSELVCINNLFENNKASIGSDIYISNELIPNITINIFACEFQKLYLISNFFTHVYELIVKESRFFGDYSAVDNAINLENTQNTHIISSYFENLTGGSAIKSLNSNNSYVNFNVNLSLFFNCYSNGSGGAINLKGSYNLNIAKSNFINNHAEEHGGAIYISCEQSQCIIYEIKENIFLNNSAKLYAGVIYLPFLNEAIDEDNIFEKNTATVGNITVSKPSKFLIFSNSTELNEFKNKSFPINYSNTMSLNASSGQIVELFIVLLDSENNYLKFDNSGEIIIEALVLTKYSSIKSDLKILNNKNKINAGIAIFDSLIIIGQPEYSYKSIIKYTDNYNSFTITFEFNMSLCKTGEIYINSKCLPCSTGFFSLDPNSFKHSISTCEVCLDNAICMGKNHILPLQGYYRLNENSTVIVKCLNENNCPDQLYFYMNNPQSYEYECTEGSYGNLCANCIEKFTKNTDGFCVNCSNDPLIYVRFFGLFAFSILFMVYQSIVALKSTENSTKKRSLLKLWINHNYYLNFLENLKEVLVGNFKSFYVFTNSYATSVPELNFDCFISDYVSKDLIPIIKVFLFSLLPFLVFLIIFLIRIIFFIIITKILKKNQKNESIAKEIPLYLSACFIITVYNFYSRLIANTFQLVKCLKLDQTSLTWLEMDPNIQCWESDGKHKYIVNALFYPNLIIWCIGWPISLILLLRYANYKGVTTIKKKMGRTRKNSNLKRVKQEMSLNSLNKFKIEYSNLSPEISNNNFFSKTKIFPFVRSNDKAMTTKIERSARASAKKSINPLNQNAKEIMLNSMQKDKIFQQNKILHFLTVDYKPDYYYWEGFFYLTNLIIATINVATSQMDLTSKGGIYITLYFLMLIITQILSPFRYKIVNELAIYSYITTLLTLGCALMSTSNSIIYFILILFFNIVFYIWWLYLFLKILFMENILVLKSIWEKIKKKRIVEKMKK